MKSILTLFSLWVICIVSVSGQTLKGKITDPEGRALADAYILHLATGNHTHTNSAGIFFLYEISAGDSIQIHKLGYEGKSLVIQEMFQDLVIQLEERIITLREIVISPDLDATNLLSEINLKTDPVTSSQDLLRKVPGLVIGQHAGGGKAEQIFLRGFDIDHGTDINIAVEGLPVNMVSHAHGQGYADLHFLIPEMVDNLEFGKGPYHTDQGNFATAGFVAFQTKDFLEHNLMKLEVGQFNTQRLLGMMSLLREENHSAYVATEIIETDGPFESPQNFNRLNLAAKYTGLLSGQDQFSFLGSYFDSQWDASGQIPQRAVDQGLISRFGAIDDTEGGQTRRWNLMLEHTRNISDHRQIRSQVYFTGYAFDLYSNFTFFLDDPENGDQIYQTERRNLIGLQSAYHEAFHWGDADGLFQAGAGLRTDMSRDNELAHTVNRAQTLFSIQRGDIHETNLHGFVNGVLDIDKWSFNLGVRFDHFKFGYTDQLASTYTVLSSDQSIISPKLNILYNASSNLQFYLKTGRGFHSNDTRVSVAPGELKTLPAATGADVGFLWKPVPEILVNAAGWWLHLEQEFVYVGDAGIVEPSGTSRRTGLDLSFRYQPVKWLYWDIDANYTLARATKEDKGSDYIPLAPDFTLMSGIHVLTRSGVYGGLRLRHIGDRPANEDNSIIAEGYTVMDMNVGYTWKRFDLGIQIQNVLDTEWNETQFATLSRLQQETEPVEEIHFTPGTPFQVKGSVAYRF